MVQHSAICAQKKGFGTKIWFGFVKYLILALNTCFGHHKHGWKLFQSQTAVTGLAAVSKPSLSI